MTFSAFAIITIALIFIAVAIVGLFEALTS